MFPAEKFEVEGVSADSGVNNQPMTDTETLQGAQNRVAHARTIQPKADYWVGIEGGVEVHDSAMAAFAWTVVESADNHSGKGKTGMFFLPPEVARLIESGKELGEADDIVFHQTNSKQESGAIGLLTNNVIDRTDYYIDAIIFALIPFKNPVHYGSMDS